MFKLTEKLKDKRIVVKDRQGNSFCLGGSLDGIPEATQLQYRWVKLHSGLGAARFIEHIEPEKEEKVDAIPVDKVRREEKVDLPPKISSLPKKTGTKKSTVKKDPKEKV